MYLHRFNRIKISLISLILLVGINGIIPSVTPQTNVNIEPIVSLRNMFPSNIGWSVDSQQVVFRNIISTTQLNEWYVYDLNTKILTQSNEPPLTPSLTAEKNNILAHAIEMDTSSIRPLSQSPDGNYLLYGVFNGEDILTNYGSFPSVQPGIANLQQSTVYTLSSLELPGIENILWSADNSAFLLLQTIVPNDWENILYIHNYTDNVAKAVSHDLRSGLRIGNTGYAVNGAYDLSADGGRALLRVNVPGGSRLYKLYIYNAYHPTEDVFIKDFDATSVIAGSFAPNDERKLWLFNEDGIVEYDLTTGKATVLDTTVNAHSATAVTINDPAIFSPDGRYLATVQETGLYIIDLADHIDIKSVNIISSSEPNELRRLWITTNCPSEPVDNLTWTVHNSNAEAVNVTWIQDQAEATNLNIPGGTIVDPGTVTFNTFIQPFSSIRITILVDGIFHDQRACFVPREG